jgi:hypothetical protein
MDMLIWSVALVVTAGTVLFFIGHGGWPRD